MKASLPMFSCFRTYCNALLNSMSPFGGLSKDSIASRSFAALISKSRKYRYMWISLALSKYNLQKSGLLSSSQSAMCFFKVLHIWACHALNLSSYSCSYSTDLRRSMTNWATSPSSYPLRNLLSWFFLLTSSEHTSSCRSSALILSFLNIALYFTRKS